MGNNKSISDRRREHEEKAKELLRREAESMANAVLSKDKIYQHLEKVAKKARRDLQLNRLGQAQKERSIRTMEEKIRQTHESLIPLRESEGPLAKAKDVAETEANNYREEQVQRAIRAIT